MQNVLFTNAVIAAARDPSASTAYVRRANGRQEMTRSHIRNLDAGYRFCEKCGRMYHWSVGFCLCKIRAEVDAIKTEAAERKATQNPDYGPASHAATVAKRLDQTAPDVDINDMRDATGKHVMPQTVEMRSWLHLLNDDNGMMGDRG